jgi:hypothetical protein
VREEYRSTRHSTGYPHFHRYPQKKKKQKEKAATLADFATQSNFA